MLEGFLLFFFIISQASLLAGEVETSLSGDC